MIYLLSILYGTIAGSKYAVIDGHLHVADVTAEDTQLAYRCFARHRLNTQQQRPVSSPPAKIILSHQQPLPMAPQLVPDGGLESPTKLRLRHARIGQDQVYMTCTVVAYPPAKIRYTYSFPDYCKKVGIEADPDESSKKGQGQQQQQQQ